jgi:hypothetical protein
LSVCLFAGLVCLAHSQLDQSFPAETSSTPDSQQDDSSAPNLHCIDLALHPLADLLALGSSNSSSSATNNNKGSSSTTTTTTVGGAPPASNTTTAASASAATSTTTGGDAAAAASWPRYAVLVRLEALTEEGRAEGRSLSELPPGAPLPHWVQSQTTYARLVQESDGSMALRVIKQKIWVRGEAYELQEIYGMERNRPGAGAAASGGGGGEGGLVMGAPAAVAAADDGFEDVDGNECVICMGAARDTAALPCRHMCMCHGCAGALRTQVRMWFTVGCGLDATARCD